MVGVKLKRILLVILFGSLSSSGAGLAAREVPRLAPELLDQNVKLEFTERTVGEICEAIGEASGIKFMFDEKTDLDKRMEIDLGSAPLEEALDMLMLLTKNFYKPIDNDTLFIAPDTRQKRQEYEDQVIQTFYLANADSQQVVTLLRSMLQARQITESRSQNTVTIKDVTDKVEIAARLIEAADREVGEVVVEFELLQVTKGNGRSTGDMRVHSIRTLPGAVSLAHPKLRIINGQAGSVFIGDSVLVPATTSCPAEPAEPGEPAESEEPAEPTAALSYQNVGIEIDVVPRINDDQNITLQLEIGISAVSPEGSPSAPIGQGPVIARRQLQTTMRLAEGETHVVSSLPALGRSAGGLGAGDQSSTSDSAGSETELILLVTPRVTREPHIAPDDLLPVWVGTEDNMEL